MNIKSENTITHRQNLPAAPSCTSSSWTGPSAPALHVRNNRAFVAVEWKDVLCPASSPRKIRTTSSWRNGGSSPFDLHRTRVPSPEFDVVDDGSVGGRREKRGRGRGRPPWNSPREGIMLQRM